MPTDFAEAAAKVIPMQLGQYSIMFVTTNLLSQNAGAKGTFKWKELPVYVSRYRHTYITVDDEKGISLHWTSFFNLCRMYWYCTITSFCTSTCHICIDILGYIPEVYKVIKSVYGDRKVIEKSLKIAVGASQDRVRKEDRFGICSIIEFLSA